MTLRTTADAIQVRCPDCPASEAGFFHGVAYGSGFGGITAGASDLGGAYFSGTGSARTYELTGAGSPGAEANWTRTTAPNGGGTAPASVGVVEAGVIAWLESASLACCGSFAPPVVAQKNGYRFAFQGQEKDDEVFDAVGTLYAYEYRMHDARIGRFMSIDPLAFAFPWNSPYAFSENRVIDMVELEGLEAAETPDKAEDPKWGLPGGGEGWTEGDSYTAESGDSFKSFKGPKPNSGPSLMPPGGGITPKSSKGFNGPTISESRPRIGSSPNSLGDSNFGLGYTMPSADIGDNGYGLSSYAGLAGLMLKGTEKALQSSAANTQFRYGTSKTTGRLTSVSNTTLTRATKIQLTSAAKLASKLGTGVGYLGIISTTFEAAADGNYTLGDFSRTLYSGASIAFPVLGLIDLGVQFGTGRSGSEWLGKGIDHVTGGWGLSW